MSWPQPRPRLFEGAHDWTDWTIMDSILQVREVEKSFGGLRALDKVDLDLEPGAVVGLIGPNGSGKTTMLNLISGALKPTAGDIRWKGSSIVALPTYQRARLGLARTFQERTAFPELSVAENLRIALSSTAGNGRASPLPSDEHTMAEYIGLDHVIATRARDLSWGQVRLLGIGLSLAIHPQLLLLDEPFAGLSPIAADRVVELLSSLIDDGLTLCVVDHEFARMVKLCRRLIVLNSGRKIAEGPPETVMHDPVVRGAYLGI